MLLWLAIRSNTANMIKPIPPGPSVCLYNILELIKKKKKELEHLFVASKFHNNKLDTLSTSVLAAVIRSKGYFLLLQNSYTELEAQREVREMF